MPQATKTNPGKWTQTRLLFDNGEYSYIWGTYTEEDLPRRALGMRWNGEGESLGFPNMFGKASYVVLPLEMTLPNIMGLLENLNYQLDSKKQSAENIMFIDNIRRTVNEIIEGEWSRGLYKSVVSKIMDTIGQHDAPVKGTIPVMGRTMANWVNVTDEVDRSRVGINHFEPMQPHNGDDFAIMVASRKDVSPDDDVLYVVIDGVLLTSSLISAIMSDEDKEDFMALEFVDYSMQDKIILNKHIEIIAQMLNITLGR